MKKDAKETSEENDNKSFNSDKNIIELFGKRLRKTREERGHSQTDVALALGKGQTLIALWEKGKREVKLSDIAELSKFLEVSPSYLMGMDEMIYLDDGLKNRIPKKEYDTLVIIRENRKLMNQLVYNTDDTLDKMLKIWEVTNEILNYQVKKERK